MRGRELLYINVADDESLSATEKAGSTAPGNIRETLVWSISSPRSDPTKSDPALSIKGPYPWLSANRIQKRPNPSRAVRRLDAADLAHRAKKRVRVCIRVHLRHTEGDMLAARLDFGFPENFSAQCLLHEGFERFVHDSNQDFLHIAYRNPSHEPGCLVLPKFRRTAPSTLCPSCCSLLDYTGMSPTRGSSQPPEPSGDLQDDREPIHLLRNRLPGASISDVHFQTGSASQEADGGSVDTVSAKHLLVQRSLCTSDLVGQCTLTSRRP